MTPEENVIWKRDAGIFEVRDLPGKGKGMVAIRDIKQGELIIRETPLFIVPPQISVSPTTLIAQNLLRLTPYQRSAFLNLSYVNLPPHVDPDSGLEKDLNEVALAIFQTNAVSAGEGVGIFPRMARLNHGCSRAFNSVYSWREGKDGQEGVLVVHALKEIKKGEELLTTYMNTKQPRTQRRDYLNHQYGFQCTCSVCSLPDSESQASDRRLSTMSNLYSRFSTWSSGSISGVEAVETVQDIWDLGNEEGYWSERGQLASDAAYVAAAHSDLTATQEWARLAVEWFGIELGSDSEQVRRIEEVVNQPRSHAAWGTRKAEKVGVPRRLLK
ncbi:SET domain-containing protein [Dendrothele bispora CBS 962.96]|uniref:SET domain-containing protein n=1 Tax=Dendrothele bispora (strain CBS 962.96) TaxID=1314807 RepID=A0A4S8MNX7_DENBC|nr:SET domain-containing protein [Dendrothele bispora CBS 962.96]